MTPSSRSSSYAAELASRMGEICAEVSFSEVARKTETNRETVRRYMTKGKPSAEFVARLCEAFGVSGTWMLTGRGAKFDAIGAGAVRPHPRSRAPFNGRAARSRSAPAS